MICNLGVISSNLIGGSKKVKCMGVYIVALPRTGSTALTKSFGAQHGWKIYAEPWNPASEFYNTFSLKGVHKDSPIVVKTMIDAVPKSHIGPAYTFHIEMAKYFDKVILLDRFNTQLQSESLVYAKKSTDWHTKYSIKSQSPIEVEEQRYYIEKCKAQLECLSVELNNNIIYYEDLYSGNSSTRDSILESWGLVNTKARLFFDPKYKYRQRNNSQVLL